ncbi:hypothetical protein NIES4075_38770 [Tolypothrix sp. NIES-4075]|uniref:hypothetical protein n=1 Tax=Tolypothrix sp. NIES-4075 TaxID=2005459 RepID=UPI000B5C8EE5|nr:hypothetical protein [Tolypothrix sp. NIES-4075]GAX42872.1 hypothetical protein NIES4075_38770 [Tolypothrix sp. NIES-4075]
MNKNQNNFRKSAKFLSTIFGGLLIGLPAIPHAAIAQQSSPKINPCPRIFYEEPHNSQVMVPQGCPPNAFTQKMGMQGQTPIRNNTSANPTPEQTRMGVGGEMPDGTSTSQNYNYNSQSSMMRSQQGMTNSSGSITNSTQQSQTSVIQPPSPQQQQPAVAMVMPMSGKVGVRLVNQTAAPISYQVIGDTALRTLQGKSEVMLQGLSTPVTVTFYRQDKGLLMVTPQGSSQEGMLQLSFKETTDVNMDKSAMRIDRNGAVFLN